MYNSVGFTVDFMLNQSLTLSCDSHYLADPESTLDNDFGRGLFSSFCFNSKDAVILTHLRIFLYSVYLNGTDINNIFLFSQI